MLYQEFTSNIIQKITQKRRQLLLQNVNDKTLSSLPYYSWQTEKKLMPIVRILETTKLSLV
ncbi:hypothetical protein C2W64_02559 [Brevibacillus laterosporus]|nr:hypothetical protein C2W64_02559 [Brevibacillus laterosporus]